MRTVNKPTDLGLQIKLKFIEKNIVAKDLAKKIGVSKSTISDVIYGKNRKKEIIDKILEGLKECI